MLRRAFLAASLLASSACGVADGTDDTTDDVEVRPLTLSNTIAFPLKTHGRYVVDAHTRRVKLKSVNWYGANLEKQVVDGLQHQPIEHIVGLIKEWGFNSVRLPFSNLMLHDTRPVPAEHLAANPDLIGLTPLEVFDRTVEALTNADILVILNNHSTFSEWCCGFDYNGLWYHDGSAFAYNQTEEMWQHDWLMLVERYRHNVRVVGADLRNEVRTMRWRDTHLPESPNWGLRDKNDWHRAARTLGNLITRANPNLLVIVEGINWWGAIPILGSGERPHLKPVRDLPLSLRLDNKLVYAAHNYGFIGPRHNGDDSTSGGNLKYPDMDEQTFYATLDDEWGYVARPDQYYSAPVWVSEFGAARGESNPAQREWFRRLVNYLVEHDLDFAYWPLNHEGYGLVTADYSSILTDDWRTPHLRRLLGHDGKQGEVRGDRYTSLNIRHGDDNQSTLDVDWLSGAHKGTCPARYRMLGMSQDQRALCGQFEAQTLGDDLNARSVQAVYESPRSHAAGDWAYGLTKYECPVDHYAAGFTKHYWGTSGLLCLRANRKLGTTCQTRWFDRGDARASTRGGDFARGSYKGQCGDNEYLAGFAQRDGQARALLCCSIDAIASFAHLDIRGGNDNRSSFHEDWLPGANKGTCPDGMRVLGMSQDHRALCGNFGVDPIDAGFGERSVQAVNESPRMHGGDWAGGMTKYECPRDYYAAGYTKHWWGASGLLCLKARRPLGNSCRTLWFDRGDNRASHQGGDFAGGSYKGQCRDDEYVAGLAQRNGNARALLCCGL